MAVILTPSVPPIIRAMFTVPNVMLTNAMACRVFRLLKLGVISDASNGSHPEFGGIISTRTSFLQFHVTQATTGETLRAAGGSRTNVTELRNIYKDNATTIHERVLYPGEVSDHELNSSSDYVV